MFGQGFNSGFFAGPPCFTDTTDIFKDNSGVALYTLDYDASSGRDFTTNTLQILGDTSCIATYPLDGSSTDLSGNYSGTDTNITYTSGYFGQSASFNGSSSTIQLSGGDMGLTFGSSASYSISFWFNTSNVSTWQRVFNTCGAGGNSVNQIAASLYLSKLYIYRRTGTSTSVQTLNSSALQSNTWYNTVLTVDGSSVKLYLNGVEETLTVSGSTVISSVSNIIFGSHGYTPYFNGSMDQIRLFNKTLTSSEVTTLYNEIGERNGTSTNVDFGVGGKSLYGARFNGSSSKITVEDSSANAFGFANMTGSISTWVNPTVLGTAMGIAAKRDQGSPGNRQWILRKYSDNKIQFYAYQSDGNSQSLTSTSTIPLNTWTHVVVTITTSEMKIYLNGVLDKTAATSYTSIQNDGADLTIGTQGANSSSNYWNGLIDQVRIFDKAISAAEVSKLYGNGAGEIACADTSTTDNIALPITNTAYYKLDNNSKDSARSTGKFNEGAIFNGSSSKIALPSLGSGFTGSSSRSVSAWVKITSTPSGSIAIFNSGSAATLQSFGYFIGTSRQVIISYYNRNWETSETISLDTWNHILFTYNGGAVETSSNSKIYINGTLATLGSTTGSATGSINTPDTNHSIGVYSPTNSLYFNGSIDQVRIYDVALSSTDVSNLYAETASDTNTLSFPSGQTAVATYQLDGNSTDLSGNYNGTDTNITYAYDGTESNIEYRFGRFGQAAVFNGSNIATPAKIPFSLNFSFSFWFNTTSTYASGYLFSTKENYQTNGYYLLANNGLIQYGEGNGSTNATTQYSTTTDLNDGNWHHCVLTRAAGGTVNMYIDNIRELNNASLGSGYMTSSNWHNNLRIGRYSGVHPNGLYYNGKLDQVRIYDAVLTSDQVTQLYNEKPEVDTSNFKAVLYNGNSSHNYISNVGFQPDLVWIKDRDSAYYHRLFDSVRGLSTDGVIYSNVTTAADNLPSINDNFSSFDDNGFTLGSTSSTNGSNLNGDSLVAWCWKGGGDAVAGSSSQATNVSYSANTEAGFSIVKFTSSTSTSTPPPMNYISHGLNSPVEMTIYKRLDVAQSWTVQHKDLDQAQAVYLDLSNAAGTPNPTYSFFDNTSQTGSIGVRSNFAITRGAPYISYCFHSVAGYSKIGSYSGSGSSGKVVTVGFKPSLVVIKRVNTGGAGSDHWLAFTSNVLDASGNISMIRWDTNQTEFGSQRITFQDTSFTLTDTDASRNASSGEYIYMAFK